jgi:hypothetical protein
VSGVYAALHGTTHRLEHELIVSEDTVFPVCRHCGLKVRFKLERPAKHSEQGWVPFGVLFEPYQTRASRGKPVLQAA